MDRKSFQSWLAGVDTLSDAQKAEALAILAGRPVGAASIAAIELGVGADRRCPPCGTPGAVANGKARRMQRYLCRACQRTFGAARRRSAACPTRCNGTVVGGRVVG